MMALPSPRTSLFAPTCSLPPVGEWPLDAPDDTGAALERAMRGEMIALVWSIPEGDFFELYEQGVRTAAEELCSTVAVYTSYQNNSLQGALADAALADGAVAVTYNLGDSAVMSAAAARAVERGAGVSAFNVEIDEAAVARLYQDDAAIQQFALDQAVKDNGERFEAIYVYPGSNQAQPLDNRKAVWDAFLDEHKGVISDSCVGTLDVPIAKQNVPLIKRALEERPNVTVVIAPYDEFDKAAVAAVREAGREGSVKIYGADIADADIALMTAEGSPWVATVATSAIALGRAAVWALAPPSSSNESRPCTLRVRLGGTCS